MHFALQVYTFNEFKIQCHASFAAKEKAIVAGENVTQIPISVAAAESSLQAQSAHRNGDHAGEQHTAHNRVMPVPRRRAPGTEGGCLSKSGAVG